MDGRLKLELRANAIQRPEGRCFHPALVLIRYFHLETRAFRPGSMTTFSPQKQRTFFVTTVTWGRRSLFQVPRNASLLLDILATDRAKGRYQIHVFAIMPDHLHLILTPAPEVPLEKAMQYIKVGFSFRLKSTGEVWQRGFTEHRIVDRADYENHAEYIANNPVRARLVDSPEKYPYCSVAMPEAVDAIPGHFLRG
jgi:putative transposase